MSTASILEEEKANGMPVWRLAMGDCWLYSGINGLRIIGVKGTREQGFKCSHGFIHADGQHQGAMPHRVSGP